MGQTLTHGVYLPDEGERNCYNGLAANWQILDSSVGTIAEHTSALSGKAPLVHTHTKSDITDFPVYGNTAGTICEGNDSRLSDARTPVAHTHTKSDVTDLLNSNFIPSANNSYDLGSSSYQWNNLYAKNYYYNGTAWGLDQNNTWTGANTFSDSSPIRLKNNNIEKGVQPTVFQAQNILFKDKNNSDVANIRHIVTASGTNSNADGLEFSVANKFANGALDPTGTNTVGTFRIGFWTDGQKYIYNEFKWRSSLIPFNNQAQDIGTSANQWNNLYAKKVNTQSVNGVNPGALSLPNSPGGTGTENVNYFDLSGNITVRDGSAPNGFTALCDGWISIETFATWLQISNDTLIIATTAGIGADGFAQAFLPVRKGNYIRIVVNQTNTQFQSFKLLPCEGNV